MAQASCAESLKLEAESDAKIIACTLELLDPITTELRVSNEALHWLHRLRWTSLPGQRPRQRRVPGVVLPGSTVHDHNEQHKLLSALLLADDQLVVHGCQSSADSALGSSKLDVT